MRRAVCPGSFDPVTNGHVDVINRAAGLYDELVVAVLVNPGKAGLFSVDERMELLRDAVAELPNVTVDSFEGLLVDYCRAHDIPVIVKGLRAVSDFEYELQMAQMNRELAGIETLFVPTAPQVGHLSSSLVKQIATFGGDVSRLVPKAVNDRLLERTPPGAHLMTEVVYRLYETVDELTTVIENARSVPMSGVLHGARATTCSTCSTTCASPCPRTCRPPARSSSSAPRSSSRRRPRPSGSPAAPAARASSCSPRRGASARSSSAPPAASATSCSRRRRPRPRSCSPRPRPRPSG